jgi:hypothetical protein
MYAHTNYPALRADHLHDAKLYATREDMVRDLYGEAGGVVGEVGVALGEFSRFLVGALAPSEFIAIDIFDLHTHETVWGYPSSELLSHQTHREYYANAMKGSDCAVRVLEGRSSDRLRDVDDGCFDLLYIDAGHGYADVKEDAKVASKKIGRNGLLIFNDYIMIDHHYATPYGVVQAVNELVTASNWKVVGFALQHQLFCDIALRRF